MEGLGVCLLRSRTADICATTHNPGSRFTASARAMEGNRQLPRAPFMCCLNTGPELLAASWGSRRHSPSRCGREGTRTKPAPAAPGTRGDNRVPDPQQPARGADASPERHGKMLHICHSPLTRSFLQQPCVHTQHGPSSCAGRYIFFDFLHIFCFLEYKGTIHSTFLLLPLGSSAAQGSPLKTR